MALSEISFVFPKILIFVEIDFSICLARFNSHPRVPTQNKKLLIFLRIWFKQLKKIKVSEFWGISLKNTIKILKKARRWDVLVPPRDL